MNKVYTTLANLAAGLKSLGYSDPINHRGEIIVLEAYADEIEKLVTDRKSVCRERV